MKNQYRFFYDGDFHGLKHQLFNVLRLKAGGEITLVKEGREYLCRLTKEGFETIKDITCDRESKVNLTLAVASLKKDKLEYVLQKCTETGVNKFILFNGDNSVKTLDKESFEKILPRYRKIIREACEQSLRLKEPEIEFLCLENMDFSVYDRIYLGDEKGSKLKEVLDISNRNILLFIGPEGGFSQEESELIKKKGGETVSFGKRIMRSETSASVISAFIVDFYE